MSTYFGETQLWDSELRCKCGDVARNHLGDSCGGTSNPPGCEGFNPSSPRRYGDPRRDKR